MHLSFWLIHKLLRTPPRACRRPLTFSGADCVAQVIMEVVSQLEGAFALLIKSTRFPGELVAAKKGSPLLLGARLKFQSVLFRLPFALSLFWWQTFGPRAANSCAHAYRWV